MQNLPQGCCSRAAETTAQPSKPEEKAPRGQLWWAHVVSWKRSCVALGDREEAPQRSITYLPQLPLPTTRQCTEVERGWVNTAHFHCSWAIFALNVQPPSSLQLFLLAESLYKAEAHAHLFMSLNPRYSHRSHLLKRNGRNVETHLNKAKSEFPKITQLAYFAPEDSWWKTFLNLPGKPTLASREALRQSPLPPVPASVAGYNSTLSSKMGGIFLKIKTGAIWSIIYYFLGPSGRAQIP